jgi:hypothetical protein
MSPARPRARRVPSGGGPAGRAGADIKSIEHVRPTSERDSPRSFRSFRQIVPPAPDRSGPFPGRGGRERPPRARWRPPDLDLPPGPGRAARAGYVPASQYASPPVRDGGVRFARVPKLPTGQKSGGPGDPGIGRSSFPDGSRPIRPDGPRPRKRRRGRCPEPENPNRQKPAWPGLTGAVRSSLPTSPRPRPDAGDTGKSGTAGTSGTGETAGMPGATVAGALHTPPLRARPEAASFPATQALDVRPPARHLTRRYPRRGLLMRLAAADIIEEGVPPPATRPGPSVPLPDTRPAPDPPEPPPAETPGPPPASGSRPRPRRRLKRMLP